MRKDYEKIFSHLAPPEPPVGLFDQIILAIKREQELQKTRRLLLVFLFLLIISSVAAPFSWKLFSDQVKNFGTLSFISAAVGNFDVFLTFWKEFSLAILESIPIMGLVLFIVNIAIFLFTVRLFLYKKRFLFGYIAHSFN